MSRTTHFAAAVLCAFMLAAFASSAFAAPALVAPKRAALRINDVNCPGNANLKFVVWSSRAGPVKVELERMGRGILGSDIIRSETRRKGAYKGVFSGKVGLTRSASRASYRIIASGGGKVRISRWVTLKSCTLVM